MRVLVTGAYGFLGSHIVRGLLREGHEVVGCGRNLELGKRLLPGIDWLYCDFNSDLSADIWADRLTNIDAVINCVGIVQATRAQSLTAVHDGAPRALFQACEAAGIRRVIQISALGAGEDEPTAYATTKASADTALEAFDLDWIVFRPSLIYGRGAYGGTALMRGLAGFPFVSPVVYPDARFQPIHMDDFVQVICTAVASCEIKHRIVNLTGPKSETVRDLMTAWRGWLGFEPAPVVTVPGWLAAPVIATGDLADWLGMRNPVTSTALALVRAGNIAAPCDMSDAFGVRPARFSEGLARDPATASDRWQARSYFLKPALIILLGLFWLLSGLIPLAFGFTGAAWFAAVELMGHPLAKGLAVIGSLTDIGLGLWLVLGPRKRGALLGQMAVSVLYLVGMTVILPGLWGDALAPVLKIFPVLGLSLVLYIMLEER